MKSRTTALAYLFGLTALCLSQTAFAASDPPSILEVRKAYQECRAVKAGNASRPETPHPR